MAKEVPDSTAVRTALWRALHTEVDSAPHVLNDKIGLELANPAAGWRERGDMHPMGTRGYRAAIVARARFVEDVVKEKVAEGITQYVILGAGLDTFAEREPQLASKLQIFEIDQPSTQEWKRKRLKELGHSPKNLHFVPVDFEKGESWLGELNKSGFNQRKPSVISCLGVFMYLTKPAIEDTLKKVAKLAPNSTLLVSFLLPIEMIDEVERAPLRMVQQKAAEAGTPFLSFFEPEELQNLAKSCGFKSTTHFSREKMIQKYFFNRSDKLVPSSGEDIIIATT